MEEGILITGASGYLGTEFATRSSRYVTNFKLTSSDSVDKDRVDDLNDFLKKEKGQSDWLHKSILDEDYQSAFHSFINDGTTKLNYAVISAGSPLIYKDYLDMDEGTIEKIFKINLISQVNMINSVVKSMLKSGYGRILFVSSNTVIWKGSRKNMFYYLGKQAVENYIKAIYFDLAKENVFINVLRPGLLEGGVSRNLSGYSTDKFRDRMSLSPLKRAISAEEAVSFSLPLLFNNDVVSGQFLGVTGGE